MKSVSKEAIANYYEGKLLEHGPTAKGVDWKNTESQELRFEQLLRALPSNFSGTILDFGCGYGALLPFLRARGFTGRYHGYDIASQMLRSAAKAEDSKCHWSSSQEDLQPADYVIASGVFNVKLDHPVEAWSNYILKTLNDINALSQRGYSANFLTLYSDEDKRRPDLYYADALRIFDYCKCHHSKFVSLFHDYPLYEFTIFIRKD